jgi:cell division transport system permease protein
LILVACVACCFLVLEVLVLISLNLNGLERQLREKVKVEVYLKDDITALQLHTLLGDIQGLREVEKVKYVSKGGALVQMENFLGKGTLEGVGPNALPASLSLDLRSGYREFEPVAHLASGIRGREGVEDVEFGATWLEKLDRTSALVSAVVLIFGALVAVAVALLVLNFTRQVVRSQAGIISIMIFLGASRWNVTFPLIIQGMLLGGAGTSVAILCLWMIYSAFTDQMLAITFLPLHLILSLILWGMILGVCGTFVSSTRYLKLQTG